jgi:hypothetical protein
MNSSFFSNEKESLTSREAGILKWRKKDYEEMYYHRKIITPLKLGFLSSPLLISNWMRSETVWRLTRQTLRKGENEEYEGRVFELPHSIAACTFTQVNTKETNNALKCDFQFMMC